MKPFLLTLVLIATQAGPACAVDFHHDFRGKPLPPTLTVFQARGDIIKEEPQGLRITIPDTWQHPFGGVGVKTTFGLRGDFEVTTTFEILQADAPPKGYGVGVCLRVTKAEPSTELSNWCRLVRKNGRQILLWNRSVEVPGAPPKYPEAESPCLDKIGRLRMKRTGATLQYLYAPGTEGDDFQQIHEVEFGADDIARVVLIGLTGRELCNLDARFLDLRIRDSEGAAVTPAAEPATPAALSATGRGPAFWLLAGLVVLGAAGVAAMLLLRRSGAKAVEVQCPTCEKRLRLGPALSGKKVKCPGCATAFVAGGIGAEGSRP